MTNEQVIAEVSMAVFNVPKNQIIVIKRLMGGMSNYTYVIRVKDGLYTFRIPGKNAEKFVDRTIETTNIDLISSLALNNNTIYLDPITGYKIAEYIDGQPLSELNPMDHLT